MGNDYAACNGIRRSVMTRLLVPTSLLKRLTRQRGVRNQLAEGERNLVKESFNER